MLKRYSFFANTTEYIAAGDTLIACKIHKRKICVPKQVMNQTIHRIGDGAFYKSRVRELHIPSSIREIGNAAFLEANELHDVVGELELATHEYEAMLRCAMPIENGRYILCDYSNLGYLKKVIDALGKTPAVIEDSMRQFFYREAGVEYAISFVREINGNTYSEEMEHRSIDDYPYGKGDSKNISDVVIAFMSPDEITSSGKQVVKIYLKRGKFYYKAFLKVKYGGHTYYREDKRYLSSNRSKPFTESEEFKVYDKDGKLLSDANLKRIIWNKSTLLGLG